MKGVSKGGKQGRRATSFLVETTLECVRVDVLCGCTRLQLPRETNLSTWNAIDSRSTPADLHRGNRERVAAGVRDSFLIFPADLFLCSRLRHPSRLSVTFYPVGALIFPAIPPSNRISFRSFRDRTMAVLAAPINSRDPLETRPRGSNVSRNFFRRFGSVATSLRPVEFSRCPACSFENDEERTQIFRSRRQL